MAKDPRSTTSPVPEPDSQGHSSQAGIRTLYMPTKAQRETLNYVYRIRFEGMKQGDERQEMEKKWDQYERQWEGWRPPKSDNPDDRWQSNHVAPVTISVVQTAVAEMVNQNIVPYYLPAGMEKAAKATLMNHVWDYGWFVSNSDLMMYDVFMDSLILGTAITQEYYRQDRRMVSDVIIGKNDESFEKEREVYDYDDIYGEIVKLQDFYWDETARSFDGSYSARDCIRRYIMDIDDFYLMYKGTKWDQFGDADKVKAGGDTEYYEYFKPPEAMDKTRQVEVLHYWSTRPRDRFVIVANDVVIRDGPNPYKHKQLPFVRWVDVKRVHKFCGKGEPELLESIQDETNTIRRMVIDRNHLDIDKMFLVSNRIGLTDEDLIARPHGLIPTDDVNSAKPVEYGDIPRSVEVSLGNLEDDAVLATGINPRQASLPDASTATSAAMMKEQTLKRIQLKLWLLQKESFPRLGQLRTENFLQFYSQPRIHKIVGDAADQDYQDQIAQLQKEGLLQSDDQGNNYMISPRTIQIKGQTAKKAPDGNLSFSKASGYTSYDLNPDDFLPLARGGYILRFTSGANLQISKPLQQQRDLELFDRFAPIAMQMPNTYDIVKLGDMILRDADKNPDDLRPDDAIGEDHDAQLLQMSLQLAQVENAAMMQGKPVAPTPYAQPAHTRVHLMFMNSQVVKEIPLDDPRKKVMVAHVMGEMMDQEQRAQNGAIPPTPGSVGNPDPMQPPPAPNGQQPPQGPPPPPSLSNGMQNKPGGMAQPATTMQNVMPNLQNGPTPPAQ